MTSAEECDCCDDQQAQREVQRSFQWLLERQKRYWWTPATAIRGESCLDSAARLQNDPEQFIAPKCWITSLQLTAGALGRFVHSICGVHFPVHYVVKYEPCSGEGEDLFFDGYRGPPLGRLPPERQIEEP